MKFLAIIFFSLSSYASDVIYVGVSHLRPTQLRYSQDNVNEFKDYVLKAGYAELNNGVYVPKINNNTSTVNEEKAVPVFHVKLKDSNKDIYAILDGHHTAIAAVQLNSSTIPVKVRESKEFNNEKEMWDYLVSNKMAYLYLPGGKEIKYPTGNWSELIDDKIRFFATVASFKCRPSIYGIMATEKGQGYKTPLWVKVDRDILYIEFIIADALYNNKEFMDEFNKYQNDDLRSSEKIIDALIPIAHKALNESNLTKFDVSKLKGAKEIPDDFHNSFKLVDKIEKTEDSIYIKAVCGVANIVN